MRSISVRNLTNTNAVPLKLGICDDFFSRLRGLMFTGSIPPDGGLLFINPSDDRINSAIHMFFMNIDLAIFWADSNGQIVDKIYAHRWKTMAAPQKNARYILETHVDRMSEYNCGDHLEINNE